MGCFPAFKNMKTLKCEKSKSQNSSHNEHVSATTPQLQASRSLHSDPRSSKASMKSLNPINRVANNRTRALSAPSALASVEHEEQEMSRVLARLMKEPRSPIPQPLPLPSPQGSGPLKLRMAGGPVYASGSALVAAEQDGLETFQYEEQEWSKNRDRLMKKQPASSTLPLPLPTPQGGGTLKTTTGSSKSGTAIDSVRYFRYEEIAAACRNFSYDRCISECLSSTIYKASFFNDASSEKLKATVTRLHSSTQVLLSLLHYSHMYI